MKRNFFVFVAAAILFSACGSTQVQTNSVKTDGAVVGIELDAAIKEAAIQMETKIPPKTMIALVSVASSSVQFSEYVISRLEAALVSGGTLVVVDRANLDKVRTEQGFQLSGEVDDESAKSIGKLLGAGAIVTGAFTNLGDVYGLTLKAINMETATVAVSYPADVAKSTRIETLLSSGDGAGGTGAAQSSAPATVYQIGDAGPAGGIIFFDMGFVIDGWRYLEAAPQDFPNKVKFTTDGLIGVGTDTSVGAGIRNTLNLVSALERKGINMMASQVVSAPKYGGFDDWFLPSRDELNLMYENLKQKGIGGFSSDSYWSSSCTNGSLWTYVINFIDGKQSTPWGTGGEALVRAIRRF